MAGRAKRAFLEAAGALHPHPDRVRAQPFRQHRFFDALDKVQVKYEMVRAHVGDDEPVAHVAHGYGVTRETVYAATRRLAARGVLGLADQKRGRKGPLKVTPAMRVFIIEARRTEAALTTQALAERVATEFGVVVHKKTVERVLAGGGAKKNAARRRRGRGGAPR
jgi:transposase